jgi:hypothetical protein
MGGRGSSSGGSSAAIKNAILKRALNSRLKGVQRDAKNGTGNYSFKNAKAVGASEALKMTSKKFMDDKKGNTLAHGLIGGKHVYYASKSTSKTIKALKQKAKGKVENPGKREINTTSTYDRWKKRHDANFAAWFGQR